MSTDPGIESIATDTPCYSVTLKPNTILIQKIVKPVDVSKICWMNGKQCRA